MRKAFLFLVCVVLAEPSADARTYKEGGKVYEYDQLATYTCVDCEVVAIDDRPLEGKGGRKNFKSWWVTGQSGALVPGDRVLTVELKFVTGLSSFKSIGDATIQLDAKAGFHYSIYARLHQWEHQPGTSRKKAAWDVTVTKAFRDGRSAGDAENALRKKKITGGLSNYFYSDESASLFQCIRGRYGRLLLEDCDVGAMPGETNRILSGAILNQFKKFTCKEVMLQINSWSRKGQRIGREEFVKLEVGVEPEARKEFAVPIVLEVPADADRVTIWISEWRE